MRNFLIAAWLVAPLSYADTLIYDGITSVCGSTISACVDTAADGDTILIQTNHVLVESISMTSKTVSLIADFGFRPILSEGNSITAEPESDITISGFTLLDGRIDVDVPVSAPGDFTITLKDNVVTNSENAPSVSVSNLSNNGLISVQIQNNQLHHQHDNNVAIRCNNLGSLLVELNCTITGNSIWAGGSSARGIDVVGADYGELAATILGNTVYGGSSKSIYISNTGEVAYLDATIISNALLPYSESVPHGGIKVYADLTTSGRTWTWIYNNSLVGSFLGINLESLNTDLPIHVWLANNLIGDNQVGIVFTEREQVTMMQNDTNLFANVGTHLHYTPTGSNITLADHVGVVRSSIDARLVTGSPAINAATFEASSPFVDADGLHRSKHGGVDIGAYEYGDAAWVLANGAAPSAALAIAHPAIDGTPDIQGLQVTAMVSDGGAAISNPRPVSLQYDGFAHQWQIANLDSTPIPAGMRFNVNVIGGSSNTFEHTTADSPFSFTLLNNSGLSNHPERIIAITPHDIGVINNHPTGVYFSTVFDDWYIYNLDGAALPEGANFNVMYQDPSKSAFRHQATEANIMSNRTLVDHPLINGVACASLQITQDASNGLFNAYEVGVQYEDGLGKWSIKQHRADASIDMPDGATFHIMVNPDQIRTCQDVIFKNGF